MAGRRKLVLSMSAALALVVVALGVFFFVLPDVVARRMNRVSTPPPYEVGPQAAALHATLFVADLHADPLLWARDLRERGAYGHVDLPRLGAGNVALQAFTVVTKTPLGMNLERNDDTSDVLTALVVAQRWPHRTWGSLLERALYQAERLDRLVADSAGRLRWVHATDDLAQLADARNAGARPTGALLGLEGMHALEGGVDNVDVLFAAGFRMLAPTHFFDTAVGGSAHGVDKGGLTAFGRSVLERMAELGMVVDLAHASPALFTDVLAAVDRPVVVSHAGVRGTCDNVRNLSDAQLRALARNGGVVGIGFWETAVCGDDVAAIVRAIRYAADLVGAAHVGLGSDFDGSVTTPFDASGLALVTEGLLEAGFTEPEIRQIMGGNALRVLLVNLP